MCKTEKTINVLVTGVGAIIGYGVIKSLRAGELPVHIVGMDIYADAVGQQWCDEFVQAIYAVDPNYIQFLKKIIAEKQIDIVFFGTEQEIYRVNNAREELGDDLKKLVLNRKSILELSEDKWLTYQFLLEHEMEDIAIPSVIAGEYAELAERFGSPLLLKPRRSYASKGICRVADETAFAFEKAKMADGFMAQPLIGDVNHEYTVAVFGTGDGGYSASISLRRQLSQEGATAKAAVVHEKELEAAVERLCKALKPIGPTNFQFRMDHGKVFLLEVNPRISSSTSIRAAFGYNEAVLSVQYFLFGELHTPKIRDGKAVRYIDEVVSFA